MDAALCMDLVTAAAVATTQPIRRVLDVGCGAGNYSLKMRVHCPEAVFSLVDLSQPMLQRASERLGANTLLYQGDIREIEFGESHFDVILAAAVLHHLRTPEEWHHVFSKFFSWLRVGGSLWVFDLVAHEISEVHDLMRRRYKDYLIEFGGSDYQEKVFAYVCREDTPTSLTYQLSLANAVGFSKTEVLHKNGSFAAYGTVK